MRGVSEITIGRTPLSLRIGLHIGLVVSGDFGSATRHQFTLIGPEVNKAARLEQVHAEDVVEGDGEIGPIRLSPEFHAELGDVLRRGYGKKSTARAKNIGRLQFYSA